MARSALLNVMVNAASKAGRSLTRDFGEVENLQISVKGPGDFVSQADLKAEKILKDSLNKDRPGYSFLLEEGGVIDSGSEHRWIIDPLDGTTNFLHGIPHFAVSVALESAGQLVAGVIYNPITEEWFTAERGRGAFVNDRRMRVANRSTLDTCVIATGVPALNKTGHSVALFEQRIIMSRTAGVRATGSAALNLAYVGAGRFDGYWESGLAAWDVAAGMLIVREAGGFATEPDPTASIYETGRIVAGNEAVHSRLRSLLNRPLPEEMSRS